MAILATLETLELRVGVELEVTVEEEEEELLRVEPLLGQGELLAETLVVLDDPEVEGVLAELELPVGVQEEPVQDLPKFSVVQEEEAVDLGLPVALQQQELRETQELQTLGVQGVLQLLQLLPV